MAHGLALKLEEMLQRNLVCRRDSFEIISEEDKLIKSWLTSSQGKFFKLDFFRLLRKTLIFVLSPSSLREPKKKELLKGVSMYFNTFSNVLKNNLDLRKPLIDVILDPWKNHFFSWDELFQEKISFRDQKVQHYLAVEPEEIVLARVHLFYHQGKEVAAMILAKCSFLYHSRIAKSLSKNEYKQKCQSVFLTSKHKIGLASVDWYLFILKNYKLLPAIVHEINQLTCHEGVLLVQRLRRSKKNQGFVFTVLNILLMKELAESSKYCCTKKIFSLWCILHKEKESAAVEISQALRKMLAPYAPSSAHFYLFADALWEQFGSSLITLYVELYVRGLTADLNHYEVAKYSNVHDDVTYLESHIASMFAKLSTLFSDFHEGAARECMFSAFSLKPTKERLYILQSLTHSILSTENEMKLNCSFTSTVQECKCDVRCDGSCKSFKDFCLEHPLLKRGISNVPFMLVKDLVTALEGVRCFSFQYNIFDWRNNATDLGDYLKDFNLSKSWESDTEYASDGSNKSDTEDDSPVYETAVNESLTNQSPYVSAHVNDASLNLSVKRKSGDRELFSLDIGANNEVCSNDNLNKRIKIDEQKAKQEVEHDLFNKSVKSMKPFGTSMGMEDAIENVIRMTLDKDKQNSDLLLNNNNFMNTSLNHTNDGVENMSLSSVNKHMAENHVYPYSLTSFGKRKNLNSDFKSPDNLSIVKSSIESTSKYTVNFKSSISNQVLMSPVSRESVISPNIKPPKRIVTMQEYALKQLGQNKLISVKSVPVSTYCHAKNNLSPDSNKKVPVYQSRTTNIESSATYDQNTNVQFATLQRSQFVSSKTTAQVLQKSTASGSSDFSKTQFLPNTSVSATCSVTSPMNVIQTKGTLATQHSIFPLAPQQVSKSDSRFHYSNHNSVNNTVVKRAAQGMSCFQDNQVMHCDRSSVIQHTMQHVKENSTREVNDVNIPNQLTVSVNSNAIEQIRCAPKEDIINLPPFTVNVTDKTITKSPVAVSANLVISRKPQHQTEPSSLQPVSGDLTPVSSSSSPIVIPGVLCPTSVIVTPWETQHKSHGELLYKKNTHALSTTSIDKRIHKNRPPYTKSVFSKQESKEIVQISTDKNRNSQALKGIVPTSHINSSVTPSSLNQNQPSSSQVWSIVNKPSTQGIPQSTSSQPWYSEPYPKPYNSNNNLAPKLSRTPTSVEQSMPSLIKPFQLTTQSSDRKSHISYSKQIHQSKDNLQNILSVPATISHSLNSPFPSSSKSSVLSNVSSSSTNLAAHPLLKKTVVHKDFTSVSFSTLQSVTSARTLSTQCNPISNPTKPSNQYANVSQYSPSLIEEKSSVVFSAASIDANLQYGHTSKNFSNSCCSPTEINPCQNCSLPPSRVNLVEVSSQKIEDRSAELSSPANNKMICKDLTSTAICHSDDTSKAAGAILSNIKENFVICQYCSHSFPASELEMHVLNSHSKEEINEKNNNLNVVLSPKTSLENASSSFKSLPDVVPEQDSLFQRESVQDNLPQTRSFENPIVDQSIAEDVKNLDPVAFNACMDLINNDKELKEIVQGIDPFNQIENNYLPFIPSTNCTDNFLSSNVCNEMPKTDVEAPMQGLGIPNKSDEFNNYGVECDQPHLKEIQLNLEKSQGVFDFTEKDYEASKPAQKLVHPKVQTTCSENVNNSKTSNELTFSALAEMIKVSMTEGCTEELETTEPCANGSEENVSHSICIPENSELLVLWNCSYCPKKLRTNSSLKRHIRKLHPDVLSVEDIKNPLSSKMSDVGSLVDSSESNVQSPNEELNMPIFEDVSGNTGPVESSNSLTPVTNSNTQQNNTFTAMQFGPILPKGRMKGVTKSPTSQCRICGKMLTSQYMKKHILKQHGENFPKNENSASELNDDINKSSSSQVDTSNFTAMSTLPDQDIDSSTCLSVSDALKRSTSYTIADASNMSGESDKLSENTNIKFNFHVLELSNENKADSKVPVTVEKKELSVAEPSCSSPTIKTELENNVKVNVTYSKKSGFILQKHSCFLCPKAYTAVCSLNKHLRSVHQVTDIPKNRRKNKKFNQMNENQNVEGSSPLSSAMPQNVVACKPEPLYISDNKGMIPECTEQLSHTSKLAAPHLSTYLKQKSGGKSKRPSSLNLNSSLLKSVLQSNFKSKQLEIINSKEIKEAVYFEENKKQSSIGPILETQRNDQRLCSIQLNTANHLDVDTGGDNSKVEFSDIQSNANISFSVPSEIPLKTQKMDNTNGHLPDAITYTLPSVSSKIDSCLDNILLESDKNLQTQYPNVVNSPCNISTDNLGFQSNEISSVSEIISNVSKCHFGGASDKDISEKELYEDNSLKLLIPKNQIESTDVSDEKDSILQPIVTEQESTVVEESKYVNTSEDSNLSLNKESEDLTVTNLEGSEAETVESKSEELTAYEQQSMSPNSKNESNKKCRLCHQNLSSIDSLSKHLKEVHDIPVLKKHISELYSLEHSKYSHECVKLSPPKLKLGTNESDSESVSDFENPHVNSKIMDSTEPCTSKNSEITVDNLAIITPASLEYHEIENVKNSEYPLINLDSAVQSGNTENKTQPKHPTLISSPFSVYNSDFQQNPVTSRKYKFRRHSFSDSKSYFNEINKYLPANKYVHVVSSNVNLPSTNCEKLKSVSLTNFQVALRCETASQIELKHDKTNTSATSINLSSQNNAKCPLEKTEVAAEHSSGENESISSVTDSTELSKTSCDTASQNCSIQWDAITVDSGFLLSNSALNSSVSKLSHDKSAPTGKMTRNFKLFEKIKSYKKQRRIKKRVKAKYFTCHKKFKTRKTFKPLILTLKEATEISEFLKTHKQPRVRLIRLKEENYSNILLNKETCPVGDKHCMKEAVVKLERMHIPSNLNHLIFIDPKVIVSDLLSDNSQFDSISMQNHEIQSINCPNDFSQGSSSADVSHSEISTVNPPMESIDFSDTIDLSSDTASLDANQNTMIEEKCLVKTGECCSVPLVKKCFVVLKRLSI